ncbi:MAG TPA: AsmA family protein [Thermodesulfobacteriota bacterium]
MPRWLRWTLASLVAVVVLVVVVLALLPTFIDVNRYRDRVVAEVERALGRQITLDRLSLSFLPTPTLGLEGLVVGVPGAPAEGRIPPGERFVALDRLELKLRLLPLLSRRIDVSRLVLERPEIVVERDAKGVLSIADLLGAPAQAPAGPGPAPSPQPGGASPLAALLVQRIEIRQGALTFRDRAVVPGKEVTTSVADLDAALRDLSLDRPIGVSLQATFLSRTPQNVSLSGTLGPLGPDADLLAAPADLSAALIDLDLDQVAAYAGARSGAAASPLTLGGTGSVKAAVTGPLGAPALDLAVDLTPAGVAYGAAFAKQPGVPLTLSAKTTSAQAGSGTPVIQVNPLVLTLHTLVLTATGTVANPTSPAVDLQVTSNEARLAGWDALVPALAGVGLGGRAALDATVRGQTSGGAQPLDVAGTLRLMDLDVKHQALPEPITNGEATVRFTGKGASIEPLRVTIGQSTLTLRAEVPDYSRRYVRFSLESPRLDLDPLVAGAAATSGEPGAAASPAASPAAPRRSPARGPAGTRSSSGEAVAGLSADGTVQVRQGTLKGVEFTDLRGDLKLRDRVFTLENLTFGLYGGTYTGSGVADLRGRVPSVTFASRLANVKANDILSANTSLKGVVFGLLSANLDIEGAGTDAATFLQSLTGEGKFSLTDGRLATIDVLDRLRALVTLAKEGQAPPAASGQSKGTAFKSLAGRVRIDDGKFITPDLDLSAADFALSGSGALGFDQTLAYRMRASIPGGLARQLLGRDLSRLLAADQSGRVDIPFTLGGTLASPTFGLSGRFIEERLKAKLGREVDENLQRGLERLLRGRGAGGGRPPQGEGGAAGEAAPGASPAPKSDPRQLLKDLFR